jgi:Concanavalin A-like lectin/glucanases superfamily
MQSFKYSIQKFGLAASLSLVAIYASCSNNNNSTQNTGPVGVVRAALTGVPSDVSCIRIEVQGARFTSQDFDVMPGTDATLLVSGVSTGSVVITVKGFNAACASVTASTVAKWVSDPISAQVGTDGVTDVSANLHRNGQVSVGITFTDDPTCGAAGGFCPPSTCTDHMKDGMESDIDCGGGCAGCPHGGRCNVNSDCGSLLCDRGRCVPTCRDGVQNGTETAVDCGGECGFCNGQACMTSTQCASQTCTNGVCVVAAPTCTDGTHNGTETDVDCGGTCGQCINGQGCGTNADCVSGNCSMGLCQAAAPSCSDGIQNGTESDVDCGGSCTPCADGRCHDDSDCASNACELGRCKASCVDGVKNGTETDVDCGGNCNPCAEGLRCQVDADCTILCLDGICGSKRCLPVGTGTTAFFRADDNYADSIAGTQGFPIGGVTFAAGIHGDGFSLDGIASAVEIPSTSAIELTGELTIDAWINPTDNGGNGRIVDKIQAFGNDGYMLDLTGFHLRAIVGGEGIQSVGTVPANMFSHVAVTFVPGGTMTLYINGRPAAAMPVVQTGIPNNTHPVILGADQGGGSLFAGIIDEVRFWNNAVDGRNMQLLFGQGPVCP